MFIVLEDLNLYEQREKNILHPIGSNTQWEVDTKVYDISTSPHNIRVDTESMTQVLRHIIQELPFYRKFYMLVSGGHFEINESTPCRTFRITL